MRTFLAYLLSMPFIVVGYPFLFLGLFFLICQFFWLLYLGQWFSADEIAHAMKLSTKVISASEFLQSGSLDSKYLHNYFLSGNTLNVNTVIWPGLKKFISWALSFHPLLTGVIFVAPSYLIFPLLGAKLPE